MISKPMLACSENLDPAGIKYPKLVSPKLDGIRCLIHPNLGAVSRRFKPIPNDHIRLSLRRLLGSNFGLDGEIVTLTDGKIDDFNVIQSKVMRKDGETAFKFMVFDCFRQPGTWFNQRLSQATAVVRNLPSEYELVEQHMIRTAAGLRGYATACMEAGYEGVIARDPNAPYKEGRSTLKQEWMLKFKQWLDAEGTFIRAEEMMHNDNEQTRDEVGNSVRSASQAGLTGAGTTGAIILGTDTWGEVRIGSGFDSDTRAWIWWHRSELAGRTVTFKYQPSGAKDKPRFPTFKGFRHEDDL